MYVRWSPYIFHNITHFCRKSTFSTVIKLSSTDSLQFFSLQSSSLVLLNERIFPGKRNFIIVVFRRHTHTSHARCWITSSCTFSNVSHFLSHCLHFVHVQNSTCSSCFPHSHTHSTKYTPYGARQSLLSVHIDVA